MKRIKEKGIYLGLFYINIILILKIIEKSLNIRNFDYIFITILFLSGALIYCLYSMVLIKKRYKIIFTFGILALIGVFVYNNMNLVYRIIDLQLYNINEIDSLIYKNADTYFYQYKGIFSIVIPLIVPIIMWLTTKISNNIMLVVNLAIVITLWYWNCVDVIKNYIYIYMFISIFTFIINRYLKIIKKMKKQGVEIELGGVKIGIYAIVISFLMCKGISILPQHYEGNYYGEISGYFENMFSKSAMNSVNYSNAKKFNLSSSGYSDSDKKLGGPMSLSYADVFKVKADKPHYLRGTVKEYYDGFTWKKTAKLRNKSVNELSGIKRLVENVNDSNKASEKEITVYPMEKLETTSFFTPLLTYNISSDEKKIYSDLNKIYSSGKIIKKPYKALYFNLNKYPEEFQNIDIYNREYYRYYSSSADDIMAYYIPNKCKRNNYTFDINDDGRWRGILVYVKEGYKYNRYLQIPENVSLKIYDLVDEIVKNCESSYDKVKKIQDYLSKNYEYTLNVSEVPEGKEFIENFIYKEKKGYCTYFATTMTMFCRIAGVPARYVEGFKMADNKNSKGLYTVSNDQAHAWCEVLVNDTYDLWSISDPAPTPYEERKRKEKEEEKRRRNEFKKDNKNNDILNKRKNNKDKENDDKESVTNNFDPYSKLARGLNTFTPIILYILLNLVIHIKCKKNILKSRSIIPLYNYYLRRLSAINIIKEEFKGDKEFVEEINDKEVKDRMKVLVNGAYSEFYGNKQSDGVDRKEYYNFIETFINKRQNKINYILKKYFGI